MRKLIVVGLFAVLLGCEYKDIGSTQCSLTNVSFSKQVQPLFKAKCSTPVCHYTSSNIIPLTNYQEISADTSD
ncbi:MAG: hypothetical protein ACKOC0_12260, partial [Cytophagales bacterium]